MFLIASLQRGKNDGRVMLANTFIRLSADMKNFKNLNGRAFHFWVRQILPLGGVVPLFCMTGPQTIFEITATINHQPSTIKTLTETQVPKRRRPWQWKCFFTRITVLSTFLHYIPTSLGRVGSTF